ncbi:hypothetical protein ACFXTO_023107 [Malus domestica]
MQVHHLSFAALDGVSSGFWIETCIKTPNGLKDVGIAILGFDGFLPFQREANSPMTAIIPSSTIIALSVADPLEALSPFLGVEGSSAEPKLNKRLTDKRGRTRICSCRHRWQWRLQSPFTSSIVFLAEPKEVAGWVAAEGTKIEIQQILKERDGCGSESVKLYRKMGEPLAAGCESGASKSSLIAAFGSPETVSSSQMGTHIHGGDENLRENQHSFSCRFPQTAPNVNAQNRRSWNNVNPTVNLQVM